MSANPIATCFVDTNVWLYAFIKTDDATKSATASHLLQILQPVVSTQVINEVCVNLLRRALFTEEQTRALIESFYEKYEVVGLTRAVLLSASQLRRQRSFSFWDSMIIASGLDAGVDVLYSEDMQHGLVVDGKMQILNPFKAKS